MWRMNGESPVDLASATYTSDYSRCSLKKRFVELEELVCV
jgi:hypothetical protein